MESFTAEPPAGGPLISVCLIVKNERANLERCLESVRSLPGELIVVDTGSTDGTQTAARVHGARVIQAVWENDFSQARNLALAAAQGRWILVLDADEYLLERDLAALVALAQQNTPPAGRPDRAFTFLQKSSADGGRTGMLARQVRLFPNRADIRYEWPIHEQVATSLQRAGVPLADAPIEIIHTGYTDPARNRAKQRRNLSLLQAQVAAGRNVWPTTCFLLGGAYLDLDEFENALASYRECRRRETGESELARGAQVRMTTCLLRLHRYEEALAGMPASGIESWHPELLAMRGEIEEALGRPDEARRWYERVLGVGNRDFVPACDLMAVKARAALFLGSYWKDRAQLATGLAILRAARDCRQEGGEFTLELLAQIYRRLQPG